MLGTLEGIYDKNFNCYWCVNQYKQKKDYKKYWAEYDKSLVRTKDIKHCEKDSGDRAAFLSENVEWYRCPGNYRSESVKDLVDAYELFKKGIMPYSGSYMEQPSKIIDVFHIIEEIIREKMAEKKG